MTGINHINDGLFRIICMFFRGPIDFPDKQLKAALTMYARFDMTSNQQALIVCFCVVDKVART